MEIEVPKTSLHQSLESCGGHWWVQKVSFHTHRTLRAQLWMQSMVYFLHPSQPASILTSGWVKRTTVITVSYQVSCLCGVASMHPWWSSCSASWGQNRTSGCCPFPYQDHCTSPWTVRFPDGTNIQHFLHMGPHIIVHVRRYTSVMLLKGHSICYLFFGLIRAGLPRSRLLWANRCSHVRSSSLACSCSSSGHFLRPWRTRAAKTHPFWGLLLDYLEVLIGRTTVGLLVGRCYLSNHSLCGDFYGMTA